jgi:hypothetical protein
MEKHTDKNLKSDPKTEADKGAHKQADTDTVYQDAAKETDADDLVHEKKEEIITPGNEEQDIDELMHRSTVSKPVVDNEERDPDDQVHEIDEFPDE